MNPWSGLKDLPREVWLLSAATLVNRAGTMVLPFLVLYLTRTLARSRRPLAHRLRNRRADHDANRRTPHRHRRAHRGN
jgi:hypothetical protein